MAHSFITNKDRLLSDIITGILPKSDAVDILVGYFYFSGYIQLADKLADKHLRILVGLDIDTRISNRVREVEELVEWQRIRSKVREEYFNNLVRLINETDNTDTDETIRIFRQFQHKIYNGTLEIRKTEDPCHAKMYLFAYNSINNENGEQPGDVITGSSNLSYQGLQGRTEINVRFTDKGKYTEGKQIFDELWSNAIPIVDENTVDRWKEKVESKIWIDRLFQPYKLYLRVLSEYFNIPSKTNVRTPFDITDGKFFNLGCKSGSILTEVVKGKQVIKKVNGKYFMYWGEEHVFAATSDDLIHWTPIVNIDGSLKKLFSPRDGYFDSHLTECGPPAIYTPKGIVLLYNGKNHSGRGDKRYTANVYAAGQALFDANDPTRFITRLDEPFFRPMDSFEKSGQYVDGTVFIEGMVYFKNKWYLYYGCADSKVGVAVYDPKRPAKADPLP